MLVPVALVERVCAIANHIRPHRHPFAFFRPRPSFNRFQQPRTSPTTPCRRTDDESIDFSSQRHLEQIRNAHMNPPNDLTAIFRDKNRVQRRWLDATQSHFHLRRRRRIPKLTRKLRQPHHIRRLRTPDAQPRRTRLGLLVWHHVGAQHAVPFFRLQRVDVEPPRLESTTKMFCPNPAKLSPDLRSPTRPTSSSETRRSAHRLQASAAPNKTLHTARQPARAAQPQ